MSDSVRGAPMLIGHRGAPGYRPEHTEASYRLAFEQGVDAVEPDIVVSKDGVLVVRHENAISATTDVADRPEFADRKTTKVVDGVELTGWFTEDFTWAELSTLRCKERLPELRPENTRFDGDQPILRLIDLIALVDEENAKRVTPIGLVIELKHVAFLAEAGHDLIALLLADLARCGWDTRPEQLTIECFEISPLDRMRESGLAARFVFLMEHAGAPADDVAVNGAQATPYSWYRSDEGLDSLIGRVHGISLSKRDLLQTTAQSGVVGITDVVARAHERGLDVYTWTMRPENGFLNPAFRSNKQRADIGDWQAEWRLILSTGLDGVFLDHPDMLAVLRGAEAVEDEGVDGPVLTPPA